MLSPFKYTIAAAFAVAAQLATAGSAEVTISNLTLAPSGGEGWYWLPGLDGNGLWPTWVAPSAATMTGLVSPELGDTQSGWQGQTLNSLTSDGLSQAHAQIIGSTIDNLNAVAASASVTATGGQSAWAFAQVFDGQILVGGNTTVTITARLDSILATGTMSQANAYIQFCSTDFTTDTCSPANYVEAFVDASSAGYSGPTLLTASWTNPGATNWAKLHIGLTASADSVAAVPEPATAALWLTGLAGLCVRRRFRNR